MNRFTCFGAFYNLIFIQPPLSKYQYTNLYLRLLNLRELKQSFQSQVSLQKGIQTYFSLNLCSYPQCYIILPCIDCFSWQTHSYFPTSFFHLFHYHLIQIFYLAKLYLFRYPYMHKPICLDIYMTLNLYEQRQNMSIINREWLTVANRRRL